MSLASLDDVKRVLGSTDASDEAIALYLEGAEAWVKKVYGGNWDEDGGEETTLLEEFYHVKQGDSVQLKADDATDVKVRVYVYSEYDEPEEDGAELSENAFVLHQDGKVELLFVRYGAPEGLPEAVAEFMPGEYSKVVVSYTPSGVVPAPVREAVALIAASSVARAGYEAGGLTGESLGDYSYSRDPDLAMAIPARAKVYLRPYGRRAFRVRST
jgi:hypothetical protein